MAVQYLPQVSKNHAFVADILALNADTLPTLGLDGLALPVGYTAYLSDTDVWKVHTGGGTWVTFQQPANAAGGGGGAATIADGADVTQGAIADAIVAAGATGTLSSKLRRVTQGLEDLKTLIVLAAGNAIIGKVGIDQTTPGTTNKVDTELAAAIAGADGSANPTSPEVLDRPSTFNETTWDRLRGNTGTVHLASVARTAAAGGPAGPNYNHKGALVIVNVTAAGGVGKTLSIQITATNPGTGLGVNFYMTNSTIANLTGTFAFLIYPGATAASPAITDGSLTIVNQSIPRDWNITMIPSDATPWTYSVGKCMLL